MPTGYERVATFGTAAEAEVVRGLLEASGIDARVGTTDHLARDHIPSGGIAVLVPAGEVEAAREVIASARAPEPPAAPRAPERRGSAVWASAVIVGLMFSAVGALALLLRPGRRDSALPFLAVGLVLAVVGALAGSVQRARRARRRP